MAGWNLSLAEWGFVAKLPPELDPAAPFFRTVLEALRGLVSGWPETKNFVLRSICLLVTASGQQPEVQAAIDGMLDAELTATLAKLPWPSPPDAYLYKQLFVLGNSGQIGLPPSGRCQDQRAAAGSRAAEEVAKRLLRGDLRRGDTRPGTRCAIDVPWPGCHFRVALTADFPLPQRFHWSA